jgi:hypothetical protein
MRLTQTPSFVYLALVGGADSSISTSVERIRELMDEIKVFVDLPG